MLLPTRWRCFLRLVQPIKLPFYGPRFVRPAPCSFPVRNTKEQEASRLGSCHSEKTKNTSRSTYPPNSLPLSSWAFRTRMLSRALQQGELQAVLLLFPHEDWAKLSKNESAVNGVFRWVDIRDVPHQLAHIPRLFLTLPSTESHCSQKKTKMMSTFQSLSKTNHNMVDTCDDVNSQAGNNSMEISLETKTLSGTRSSLRHDLFLSGEGCILAHQKEFLVQVLAHMQKIKYVYHLNRALGGMTLTSSSKGATETFSMREVDVYPFTCGSSAYDVARWPYEREEARVIVELIAWYKQRESISLLALLYGQVHSQEISQRKQFVRWLSTELEAVLNASPSPASSGGGKHTCLLWLVNRVAYLDNHSSEGSSLGWIAHEENPPQWLSMCTDCICAASWTDLFTTDAIVALNKTQNMPPRASKKDAHATDVPHVPPFADFASLFDSLPDSTDELSMPIIDTEPLTKSFMSTEEDSFESEGLFIFKYDPSVHAGFEVLRRRLAAFDLPICPSLRIYWRCVLVEMLRSGWEAVAVLADTNYRHSRKERQRAQPKLSQHSPKLRKGAEYYAVGVFLSFRRMLSAFSKHQLLKPLIELHELATGYRGYAVGRERETTFEGIARHPINTTSHVLSTGNDVRREDKLGDFADRAAAVRQDILSGKIASPLLWRELVLFDAFMLINLGHTSEKASDLWDAVREVEGDHAVVAAGLSVRRESNRVEKDEMETRPLRLEGQKLRQHLVYLQEECLKHLAVLEASSSREGASVVSSEKYSQRASPVHQMNFIVSAITPKTRAGLISRLKEGLRLSAKVLLSLGDTASVCALYKAHGSSIGGSWEAGKALIQEGAYDIALDAFRQLLRDTHGQYPSGLPRVIQDMILEAITGIGNEIISVQEDAQQKATELVGPLIQRYEQLRGLLEGQLLPAPVCLHALLKGILKGPSSAASAPSPLRVSVGSRFLMEYIARYSTQDGFLPRSVDAWIECFLATQRATTVNKGAFDAVEQEFLRALTELLQSLPHLPVVRISLIGFLRAGYQRGVYVVLSSLVGPRDLRSIHLSDALLSRPPQGLAALPSASTTPSYLSNDYCQATLNSLPRRALEELAECLALVDDAHLATDLLQWGTLKKEEENKERNIEEEEQERRIRQTNRLAYLRGMVARAMSGGATSASSPPPPQPWQCFLCRTWNSALRGVCKLCESLDTAVVQCAQCGGFSSTRDAACLVCGVDFSVNTDQAADFDEAGHSGAAPLVTEATGRSADAVLHATAFKAVFPLRAWSCEGCGRTNDAKHIFYCSFCNSQNAALRRTLTETSYTCSTCERVNPQGLLRPWCSTCGTLSPAIPTEKEKALWYCPACHHLNPWLLVHCERCTEGRPLPVSALGGEVHPSFSSFVGNAASLALTPSPFITVPWDTIQCHACRVVNPLVARFCRSCGCALTLPSKVREAIDSALIEWVHGVFAHPANPALRGENDRHLLVESSVRGPTTATSIACSYCGHCQTNSVDAAFIERSVCERCHACLPGFTVKLWVCLQPKCFHVNAEFHANPAAPSKRLVQDRMNKDAVRLTAEEITLYACSACHTSHPSVDVFHLPLQSPAASPSSSPSLSRTSSLLLQGKDAFISPLGYQGELHRKKSVTALLCFPALAGPTRRCICCGMGLAYSNLAGICPQCGRCQPAFSHKPFETKEGRCNEAAWPCLLPTQSLLAGWMILLSLLQAVSEVQGGPASNPPCKVLSFRPSLSWLLKCLPSAMGVLRSMPEELLPWRGCDLQNRMLCGVAQRVAVLEDEMESVHSAILLVREIIRGLCAVASSFSESKSTEPSVFSECLESDAVWEKQRPWLLAAGDLVEVVNSSTDFDEIGFPLLAKLCQLIRPHEMEHIRSKTRSSYLHVMKLTREAMVNEVVCARCFGRHKKDEACRF